MKRVPKEVVEDISNHILRLFDQKLSGIEARCQAQHDSISNMRNECADIEKSLNSMGINEEPRDFSVCESLAVELKSYLRSKPSGSIFDESQRLKTQESNNDNEDRQKNSVLDQLEKEDANADLGSLTNGNKFSPIKGERKQSKQNSPPEKNSVTSPKVANLMGRPSSAKKVESAKKE